MKVLKEIKLRSGLVDLCDAIAFDENRPDRFSVFAALPVGLRLQTPVN